MKIFIVGNSRSGTTMLGRILGRHPAVHTFEELHFFEQQVDGATISQQPLWSREEATTLLESLLTSSRNGFFAPPVPGRYRADAATIVARSERRDPVSLYAAFLRFETERNGKSIPCEQTPRYLFFAQDILAVFPDARIVNIARDPRDVLISQKKRWKRRFLGGSNIPLIESLRAWVNYHPFLMAWLWVRCIRQGRWIENDSRVMSLRFEDLLADPDAKIRDLCSFVGIEFETFMLDVPQVGSSSVKDRPDQRGIDQDRAYGWRRGGLNRSELAICEWVAKTEMQSLGYNPIRGGSFPFRSLPSFGLLFLKLLILVPMNLSRTKNLRETLRRRLRVRRHV